MVVPTVLAIMARRNWARWADSSNEPDRTSATVTQASQYSALSQPAFFVRRQFLTVAVLQTPRNANTASLIAFWRYNFLFTSRLLIPPQEAVDSLITTFCRL